MIIKIIVSVFVFVFVFLFLFCFVLFFLFQKSGGGGAGGGGRNLDVAILNVNNLINIEANASKLGDFSKNYLAKIGFDMSLSK